MVEEINSFIQNKEKIILSDESRLCLNLLIQSSWFRSKGFREACKESIRNHNIDVANLLGKFQNVGKMPNEEGTVSEINPQLKESIDASIASLLSEEQLLERAKEKHCQHLLEEGFIDQMMISGPEYSYHIHYSETPVFNTSDTPSFKTQSGFKMAINPYILVESKYDESLIIKTRIISHPLKDVAKLFGKLESGEYKINDTLQSASQDVIDKWNWETELYAVDNIYFLGKNNKPKHHK